MTAQTICPNRMYPMTVTLKDIEQAASRIDSAIIDTPFQRSETLTQILGAEIFLKFENLQFTSSFKERGALNRLLQLNDTERHSGVIAMSAGNHAKAVAYHAQRLGIPATIVMPKNTPHVKVEDTKNFNARVILEGAGLTESAAHAHGLAAEEQLVFVHPYDDPAVIAGAGTVALEMLRDVDDLDVIVVPIGGGGLIAGIATAAKAIRPGIKIVGVEVEGYPGAYNRVNSKETAMGGATIAEGIAVKQPGTLNMEIIERLVDDIVLVSEDQIEEAINLLITIEKTVSEGAGAAGLAAVMTYPEQFSNKKTAIPLCGANIDPRILASVLMRQLARKGSIVRYLIKINDLPGTLSDIAEEIGNLGGNILEVSHQRMFASIRAKDADLYFTVETRGREQSNSILDRLIGLGYDAALLDN